MYLTPLCKFGEIRVLLFIISMDIPLSFFSGPPISVMILGSEICIEMICGEARMIEDER